MLGKGTLDVTAVNRLQDEYGWGRFYCLAERRKKLGNELSVAIVDTEQVANIEERLTDMNHAPKR
jgi:hypothetical protein